jgi:hypothetical protein
LDNLYKGCGTLQIHEGGVTMIRILDRDDIDAVRFALAARGKDE